METNGRLPPVSRKKTRLDPISPDILRRSGTNFNSNDSSRTIQLLIEENQKLKAELEVARKEVFQLKEENIKLKKNSKGGSTQSKNSTTFLTSSLSLNQNGGENEESKWDSGDIVCHNWNQPIAKQNYSLHVIYWEKNFTECSYCKMKLNKTDLDAHIEEERGNYSDLLEAVTNCKNEDIKTMYEHGNDIFALDNTDTSENTLLHVAVRNLNKETAELLLDLGINVNSKNKNNETPLHIAVAIKDQEKAEEITEIMLWKGADPHSKDKLGETPVHKAKRLGKSNILLLMSRLGDERLATPSLGFRM